MAIDRVINGRGQVGPTVERSDEGIDRIWEQRTGLPVNPVIASVKRWNDDADPLITRIKSSPSVEVDLQQSEVGA